MLSDILKQQKEKGVEIVKAALSKDSATGKTVNSVEGKSDDKSLQILARPFIEALETGRGPRKSSTDGGFKDSMIEYCKARGMGLGLSEKQLENLAKFLVLKINREGDQLYRMGGGRDVYTKALEKFAEELEKTVTDYMFQQASEKVFKQLDEIK